MTKESERFEFPSAYRRKTYVIGLGFGVSAVLMTWIIKAQYGNLTPVDALSYPVLLGLLAALGLALWLTHFPVRVAEIAIFVGVALYLLAKFAYLAHSSYALNNFSVVFLEFAYWFFPIYAAAFLLFGVRNGLKAALACYLAAIAVGMAHLVVYGFAAQHLGELYGLSQLYLAGGVIIFLLYTSGRLIESHASAASDMAFLAHTDALTGVSNRRRLEQVLSEEASRVERYGGRFSVLLLDLDDFKNVNDNYGHDVGDEVLRELAGLLRAEIRDLDHLGRWGGEEFLIILPGVGLVEAQRLALRLKNHMEIRAWAQVGRLTASIGLAEFCSGRGVAVERLLKQADEALYRAKVGGKNRIVAAQHEPAKEMLSDPGLPSLGSALR